MRGSRRSAITSSTSLDRRRLVQMALALLPILLLTFSFAYSRTSEAGAAEFNTPVASAPEANDVAQPRLDFQLFFPWLARTGFVYLPWVSVASLYDWLQFNGDPQHSGNNRLESTITPDNVGSLRRLFRTRLGGTIDGVLVSLAGVATPQGTKNLVFGTTMAGGLLALDAQSGAEIWSRQHPAPGGCDINNVHANGVCFTTSSPAIDPNRQFIYSYGLDGYIHKHRVGDGAELSGGGWPAQVTAKNFDEKGSSALSLATARSGVSYLYMVTSSYPGDPGDGGDYQGHLTAINLSDGSQHVFNALCSDQADVHFVEAPGTPDCPATQAGLWARAGVVYDPDTDRIYATTGNATFDPGLHNWGDTVFALRPDGTGSNGNPLDSYTPFNYTDLQANDMDLGSTTIAILPVPASSHVQHLAVQGGKDRALHLINLDNMSGAGGPGHVGGEVAPIFTLPIGGEMHTAPAVWSNPDDNTTWVFMTAWSGVAAFHVSADGNGAPNLSFGWSNSHGATSPIVANDILYYVASGGLFAVDPESGAVLWQAPPGGNIHWESPVVANGVVYVADTDGYLNAFALPQQAAANRRAMP